MLVCFLLLLKREIKKRLILAACFLCLETLSLPVCYPLRIKLVFPVSSASQVDSSPAESSRKPSRVTTTSHCLSCLFSGILIKTFITLIYRIR